MVKTIMEKSRTISKLLPTLEGYINRFKKTLLTYPLIAKFSENIFSETWVNPNGIGFGAVAYLSRPDADAIEFTIDLIETSDSVEISIGIFTSTGIPFFIVEEKIIEKVIEEKEIISRIGSILDKHFTESIEKYLEIIIMSQNIKG